MKVFFEKTLSPCIANEVILWHVAHGWVWNVRESSGRYIGVFFATLLCGDGVIIHFDSIPNLMISPATVASAIKKGIRIAAPLGVVFATVRQDNKKLISIISRLGFRTTDAGFYRSGEGEIILLKYFPHQKSIL